MTNLHGIATDFNRMVKIAGHEGYEGGPILVYNHDTDSIRIVIVHDISDLIQVWPLENVTAAIENWEECHDRKWKITMRSIEYFVYNLLDAYRGVL